MHADVLGDVAQDQRLEVRDALVEELALELQDRLGDLDDRALPLLDRADQPLRARSLSWMYSLRLGAAGQRVPVEAGDLQLGQAVVVGDDEVLVADLVDVDVGGDVVRLLGGVLAARLRVEAP